MCFCRHIAKGTNIKRSNEKKNSSAISKHADKIVYRRSNN